MIRPLAGGPCLLAIALACAGPGARAQDEPKGTPAEQVASLEKAYNTAMQEFSRKYGEAKTDEERSKLYESSYPKPEEYATRMLAIARAHPDDPAEFAALSWVVRMLSGRGTEAAGALETLGKKYAEDARIADVVQVLEYASGDNTPLLEKILEKNPDRKARGMACFTLAEVLKSNAETAKRLRDDEELRKRYVEYAGEAETARLSALDPEDLEKRAVTLYERVRDEFGDIEGFRGTLGERAERVLFEVAHLGIGKVAPEVEGEDIDGVKFKLSDYRGKVVLIDFWGDW